MTIYGFNDESVARKLKEIARETGLTLPSPTPQSSVPSISSLSKKLHLAIITEEVTAAEFDTEGEYNLGKGKAVILFRNKLREGYGDGLSPQTAIIIDPDTEAEETVDIEKEVFNFTTSSIQAQVITSRNPLELESEHELVLVGEDYLGDLFVLQGGSGSTATIGRTLEHIPAATGSMDYEDIPTDPEDPDAQLKRPLYAPPLPNGDPSETSGVITVSKGKVWPLKIKPPPEPEDPPPDPLPEYPVELEDRMQEKPPPDPLPDPPPDPEYEAVVQEWYNPLFDAILKNSIVMGTTFGGKTMIMSVAPTTIKKEEEPEDA